MIYGIINFRCILIIMYRRWLLEKKVIVFHRMWNFCFCLVLFTKYYSHPVDVSVIYINIGTSAGSYYSNTGGGSNYLCMPSEPIYDEYETSASTYRALLYSAEYQTNASPVQSQRIVNVHDHTPSCAVCRAPPGSTGKLMVPARNECPSSEWRLEYAGYLMAERYSHQRSEFICMDREMEAEPGTMGNAHGALFYSTEARCLAGGGLPCGPYVNGYELTCAVCTI